MFSGCSSLSNIKGIEKWNVSNGVNFSNMFAHCESLLDIKPLEKWNVSKGTYFIDMFARCLLLSDIKPLEKWNVSNSCDLNCSCMFACCKIKEKDIKA